MIETGAMLFDGIMGKIAEAVRSQLAPPQVAAKVDEALAAIDKSDVSEEARKIARAYLEAVRLVLAIPAGEERQKRHSDLNKIAGMLRPVLHIPDVLKLG